MGTCSWANRGGGGWEEWEQRKSVETWEKRHTWERGEEQEKMGEKGGDGEEGVINKTG